MKDRQLMLSAFVWAACSTAERLKVGAILSLDNRILCQGYNGTLPGDDNNCEDEFGNTKDTVMHAEQNLLMFAARKGIPTGGCTIHITHAPCVTCSKLMIAAGIKRVVYQIPYRLPDGVELLEKFNIDVLQYENL